MQNTINNFVNNLRKPIHTPIGIYLLSFILPALTITMPLMVLNWSNDYVLAHMYFIGTLGQALMDIPAVFMFYKLKSLPENQNENNIRNRIVSGVVGFICAFVLAALRIVVVGHLMGGRFMGQVPAFTQSFNLNSPWNMISAVMALLAYGPGEALFVVYFILAFDIVLDDPQRIFSWGVIVTAVLWALPHAFNILFYGLNAIPNILIMFFVGLIMGILLKKTKSSWGPIVFWTLVNGTSI